MKQKKSIDYSMTSTFFDCERKYYWRYIKNLTPKTEYLPFLTGRLIHKAIQNINNNIDIGSVLKEFKDNYNPTEYTKGRSPDDITNLIINYYENNPLTKSGIMIIEAESKIFRPIIPGWNFTGRIDGIGLIGSTHYNIEYKTTSSLGELFIASFSNNAQITGYTWLSQSLHSQISTIVVLLPLTKTGEITTIFTARNKLQIELFLKSIKKVILSLQDKDNYISNYHPNYCNCGGTFPTYKQCDFYPICYSNKKDIKYIKKLLFKSEIWTPGGINNV